MVSLIGAILSILTVKLLLIVPLVNAGTEGEAAQRNVNVLTLYEYHELIDREGHPTALFQTIKDRTDVLVEQARLAYARQEGESVKLSENGSCAISSRDFDSRQAIAVAFHSSDAEGYRNTFSQYKNTLAEMSSQMPILQQGLPLEDEFEQRREYDQFWRKKITARAKGYGLKFSTTEAEDIFYNYVIRQTCLADTSNRLFLKKFVEKNGWPSQEVHGPLISYVAWLITQHSDRDVDFQKQMLALLEAQLHLPTTNKSAFAFLFDRVATNSLRPQRYGTQIECKDGQVVPKELEDPAELGRLRESVELEPIEEYLVLFTHCGTDN